MDNNDRISLFMGKLCTCTHLDKEDKKGNMYWGSCLMHGEGGKPIPWDTDDARAVEILPRLVAKGYRFELNVRGKKGLYTFGLWLNPMDGYIAVKNSETIAGAIAAATLQLIESFDSRKEG